MDVTLPEVPPRRRLAWFAAIMFVSVFGLGEFLGWVLQAWGTDGWWGIDLRLILDAGARLTAGADPYADPRFLYPPLAAVVGEPLAPLPFDVVSITYASAKIVIAGLCVARLTQQWRPGPRVLAMLGLVLCLPFLHDVMVGNVNVVLVAAAMPAVLGSSRARNGILLGVVAAIFAKPLLLPIFLWLLVWRRATFAGAVVGGVTASLVGLIAAGPATYLAWLGALAAGTRYAAPFAGNHGVTAIAPALWLPIAAVVVLGLIFVLLRRGPEAGLTWAVTSGLLLAPYAGTYGALPIALALPGMAVLAPLTAFAVVAVSPIATTHPLPIYAAAILLAALAYREVLVDHRTWRDRTGSGDRPAFKRGQND